MLTPKEKEKGREETEALFIVDLINLASQQNSTWTRNNFGQKLHENKSEVLLCSFWIFTKTELSDNALQTLSRI